MCKNPKSVQTSMENLYSASIWIVSGIRLSGSGSTRAMIWKLSKGRWAKSWSEILICGLGWTMKLVKSYVSRWRDNRLWMLDPPLTHSRQLSSCSNLQYGSHALWKPRQPGGHLPACHNPLENAAIHEAPYHMNTARIAGIFSSPQLYTRFTYGNARMIEYQHGR